MRPEKLIMENFGPFSGRAELDFSKLEDIFLISGKTGAGKTTIFDAMCFSLYGKVPGSRGAHPGRLRSDHTGEDGDCFVSLEFTLGEKRYLAERRPRQERKKKRGEGVTIEEETFVFYEIDAGGNVISNADTGTYKKSELDLKLKNLIGLEADEFFKIVLLPQGEFAEFLKESTAERQKVLGKLFPVEKAVKIKELARKKANEAEAQAKGAARVLEDTTQKLKTDDYEKLHAETAFALQTAEKKSLSLEKEDSAFGQILSLRKNERETGERLAGSKKMLEEAEAGETSINKKSALLSRSRAARPLEQFLRGLESSELAAKNAEIAFAGAAEEKEAASLAAVKAEEACTGLPAFEKELNALRERRPALMEILAEEEKLSSNGKDLERQNTLIKKLCGETYVFKQDLEKLEIIIKETEALAAGQPAIDEKYTMSKAVKDLLVEFRKYRERMDAYGREELRSEREMAESGSQAAELEKRIPVLEAEIKKLREEKTQSEQADMAAHLSVFLEPGRPCPVCGSTKHPCPAQAAEDLFAFDERIRVQEASLKEAEKKRSAAGAALEAAGKEAKKIREEAKALEREIGETIHIAFPSPPASYHGNNEVLQYLKEETPLPCRETIDRLIKTEADGLNEIVAAQKAGREAAARINGLFRLKTETQGKKGEAGKQLVAAEEQKKNLIAKIAESREKRKRLLGSDEDSAAAALAALDRIIAEKESFIVQRRKERENALVRLSGAASSWDGASRNKNDSYEELKKAHSALEKALSSTEFSGAGEAEKALLDIDAEKLIEQELRIWRENRSALRTQIAEQEKQLDAIQRELSEIFPGFHTQPGRETPKAKIPDLEEAEERLGSLKAERAAAEKEKNSALAALTSLEKDRESLVSAQKRYDELSAIAVKFKALEDDLWGSNPKRLPFDSWLLGNYLEEAAAYASARLEKMSEYRYSLLLDTETQQGRRYTGLELLVFDAHTGKTRPCATLSGGESFMASISLALGLADSIQNRSGGVRLDAVFIDEGFGSLDEASLDKALVILDELRDRRMVGIISHVSELRSRIPCRVEVIKTASGSHIE